MKLRAALAVVSPWAPHETVRMLAFVITGTVVVVVAWWAGSRQAALDDQVRWVNLGVIGFIAAAVGLIRWVRRARDAVRDRRRQLLPDVADVRVAPEATVVDVVTVGPGLVRFHRPSCVLAQGRDWQLVDRAAATADGRQPCGVCRA